VGPKCFGKNCESWSETGRLLYSEESLQRSQKDVYKNYTNNRSARKQVKSQTWRHMKRVCTSYYRYNYPHILQAYLNLQISTSNRFSPICRYQSRVHDVVLELLLKSVLCILLNATHVKYGICEVTNVFYVYSYLKIIYLCNISTRFSQMESLACQIPFWVVTTTLNTINV
jgi:hypothetical protein